MFLVLSQVPFFCLECPFLFSPGVVFHVPTVCLFCPVCVFLSCATHCVLTQTQESFRCTTVADALLRDQIAVCFSDGLLHAENTLATCSTNLVTWRCDVMHCSLWHWGVIIAGSTLHRRIVSLKESVEHQQSLARGVRLLPVGIGAWSFPEGWCWTSARCFVSTRDAAVGFPGKSEPSVAVAAWGLRLLVVLRPTTKAGFRGPSCDLSGVGKRILIRGKITKGKTGTRPPD